MPLRSVLLVAALTFTVPALGQDGRRDLCPDRPGLGTPACTLDSGATMLETGIADWTLDRDADSRTDSFAFGGALLRTGLTPSLEAQIGWTMLGHVRERDRPTGDVARWTRTGDVTLALRQNLINPDSSGFSAALMPYATLAVGGEGVGAGDWGAGLIVPVSFELGAISLGLSPHVDAAVDADGDGRHLAYGSVAGLGFALSDEVSATAELSLTRDRDPGGHATEALAGLSLGWESGADSQWDMGVNAGLNRNSADIQLYAGYARRF
ncbi:transporter [Sphingopyxis sp. SE2]|uniref:transporter n=1 Tax=unclassified Sphingopyxis TaxID=2614943 RepID=UPI00050DFCB5|nr:MULTISPECIES: transporter [unclassified Sphingopyxis]KGB58197.1 hypothetical protein FG95_01229 [Sphingopyxis sp. LC363]MDT7527486.1 transporter [Sphingopyxis sp. SE2]